MSNVTQELLNQISKLDEEQQQAVLEFARKLPTARSERSLHLSQWLVEAQALRRELREKYGENHFNSQAMLDELREEESE